VKNPSKKKPKIETKSATKTDNEEIRPSMVKHKVDVQSPSRPRKPKAEKGVKRVKHEPIDSGAKAQDVKAPRHQISVKTEKKSASRENKKFIGAHVSISGGLFNAVYSAVEIGAKAFAMFLRSQRQWNSKPLDDKVAQRFREACLAEGFSPRHILPHGIYLMNCGSPDDETLAKSRNVLVEELQRCEKLGLTLYNFHPGSTCGKIPVKECLSKIAESINIAHSKTNSVITVLENMSCQGNTVSKQIICTNVLLQKKYSSFVI
jgi:AP endonuclease-1